MRTLLELLKPYRKAVMAGVIAALFAVLSAAIPLVSDGNITGPEVGIILGAGLTAFLSGAGITYRVPNVPAASGARKAS